MISNLNKSSVVDPSNLKTPNASRQANSKVELKASQPDEKGALGKAVPNVASGSSELLENEKKDSFDAQLIQAGAIANAQANVQKPASQVTLSKSNLGFGTAAQAHMSQAEYSPSTAKAAASLSTGSSVAGLKPWSGDWIFEGMEHPNAGAEQIRPLIGGGSQAEELAQFQSTLKQLGLMAGAQQPGAAQVINLRSRGDQGIQENIGDQADIGEKEAIASVEAQLASRLPQQLARQGVEPGAQPGIQHLAQQGQGTAKATELGGAVGLEQAISQMNGQIIGQSPTTKNSTSEKKVFTLGEGSGLSGSEFLRTLTDARSGKAGAVAFTESGSGEKGGAEANQNRPELRLVENSLGGKGKKLPELSSGGDFMSSSHALRSGGELASTQTQAAPIVVTGHVVQGNSSQDRLSHEAVLGMSNAIKNLGQNGGEMKIHLKPDNLGDLHLKVTTQGRDVGLQILASDETAKKILQDSIGSLKESLATQNLTLGKIELSVGRSAQSENSNNQSGQNGQPSHMSQDVRDMMGQNAGQQNQGSGRWSESTQDADGSFSARPLRAGSASVAAMAAAQARASSARNDGRLDVRA